MEDGAGASVGSSDAGRPASGAAPVDNGGESKASEAAKKAENRDVHTVGYIDPKIYSCVEPEIRTNEVIITEERISHIKERHPGDYEKIANYLREIVEKPDYILESNKPHTATILKNIKAEDDYIRLILRLAVSEDEDGRKNSIITLMKTNQKRYENYINNKKILYKAPDTSYNNHGTV